MNDNLSAAATVVLRELAKNERGCSVVLLAKNLSASQALVREALGELQGREWVEKGNPLGTYLWTLTSEGHEAARFESHMPRRPYPGRQVHAADHPEAYYSPSQGYITRGLTRSGPEEVPPLVRVEDRRVVHELPKDAVKLVPETKPVAFLVSNLEHNRNDVGTVIGSYASLYDLDHHDRAEEDVNDPKSLLFLGTDQTTLNVYKVVQA